MAEVKALSRIREKWQRVTPGRTQDYQLGIENPRRSWADQAKGASGTWKAGVDAASNKGMYQKGVEKAGDAKWKGRALAKGPGRFSEGVYMSAGDYEKGFAPYRAAIESVDLGPKFPRRDPRNLERVRRVVTALTEAKQGA